MYFDGRRQIAMTEAGDGMHDRRWRLGRRHAGVGGKAGDRGRTRSSPVGAMAAALGRRDEVPTCAAAAGHHGIVVAQTCPLDAIAQLLPRTRTKGARSLEPSSRMEGSALADAGLGDEGR
jgi:hypothetical protein